MLILGALVVLALALVSFLPILVNGFIVDWDDGENFIFNTQFQGWGWEYFRWAWTKFQIGVYQPLAWLVLEVQYAVWNLEPIGYHAVSLVFHGVNAVLLYALTLALLRRADPASFALLPRISVAAAAVSATLFAIHPLRVEAVAWVSSQPYLPCAMFCLLAVLTYLRAVTAPSGVKGTHRGLLAASVGLYAAALLSKAMALGLPFVLLALDVYPLRRLGGDISGWFRPSKGAIWTEKLPYLVLFIAFALVAVVAKKDNSLIHGWQVPQASLSLAQLWQSLEAVAFYVLKTLLPRDLGPYYAAPKVVNLASLNAWLTVGSVLGITLLFWRLRMRWPALLTAWVCYLAMLAPTLGAFKYSAQIAADRYSYLPAMAFHVLLAGALLCVARKLSCAGPTLRRFAGALAFGLCMSLVLVLGLDSWKLSRAWQNSMTLWSWADRHGGASTALVQYQLGRAHLDAGQATEAMRRFSDALSLDPGFAMAYADQAWIWASSGDYVRAEAGFRRALSISPNDTNVRQNLAQSLKDQGRPSEAVGEYAVALRYEPGSEQLKYRLLAAIGEPGVDPDVASTAVKVLSSPSDMAVQAALSEAVNRSIAQRGRPLDSALR